MLLIAGSSSMTRMVVSAACRDSVSSSTVGSARLNKVAFIEHECGNRPVATAACQWQRGPNPLIEQVVGVDVREPTRELSRTDFVRADIRHSLIGKLVRALGIDTVVHTNLIVDPRRTSARIAHETNVIGTMNLLAACSGADSPVRKLVVKSSTAIYGSEPDDPSFWTEDMTRRTPPRDAFSRDIVEVESYVRDFALRQREATVTVLRFTNVLGPLLQTPFQAYFGLPVVPTVLGFDPRLQFLHEEEAVEALYR